MGEDDRQTIFKLTAPVKKRDKEGGNSHSEHGWGNMAVPDDERKAAPLPVDSHPICCSHVHALPREWL